MTTTRMMITATTRATTTPAMIAPLFPDGDGDGDEDGGGDVGTACGADTGKEETPAI